MISHLHIDRPLMFFFAVSFSKIKSIPLEKNTLVSLILFFFQAGVMDFICSSGSYPVLILYSLCWYVWIHKADHRPNFCLQILYPFSNSAYYSLLRTEKQTSQLCGSFLALNLTKSFFPLTHTHTHSVNSIIIHSICKIQNCLNHIDIYNCIWTII